VTPIRERIIEVLRKYNVKLPGAPLDALVDAMERIVSNDVLRLNEMRETIEAHKRKRTQS
jgi:hypothetical protein